MGEVISYTKEGVDGLLEAVNAFVYASYIDGVLTLVRGDDTTLEIPLLISDEVASAIATLVGAAPETLNTLNEIADAINDDEDFATNMAAAIALKISTTEKGAASGVATLDAFSKVTASQLPANMMGVVVHGADPNVARPTEFSVVHWIGTVEPVNVAENDLWTNA